MNRIVVLISTYNGQKYLDDLIKSLLNQHEVDLQILIRDDGSNDDTLKILENYIKMYDNIKLFVGKNIGATESFYEIIRLAKNYIYNNDYIAFCDQDDIWENNKLINAIKKIKDFDLDLPNLYFSNLKLFYENKNNNSFAFNVGNHFDPQLMAFSRIFVYGCTCVFNKKAYDLFLNSKLEKKIYHDNWIFEICAFLGNVYYDNNSYILYRQHGDNVSGEIISGYKLFYKRLKKLFNLNKDDHQFENYANALLDNFQDILHEEDINFLLLVSNYRKDFLKKCKLLLNKRTRAENFSKTFCVKTRILLNQF